MWTAAADHGWWTWREVYAQDGMAGGVELPNGMRSFPVTDQKVVTDEDGNRWRQDIHPTSPEYDELLSLVVPYVPRFSSTGKAYRPVKDKVGVNIVEVSEDGGLFPKVLCLTGARGVKLKKALRDYREMVDGFSAIGKRWRLTISGQGATEDLDLRWLKTDPKTGEPFPPIDLPEPFDIPALLMERRERIRGIVEGHTGIASSEPAAVTHGDVEVLADDPKPVASSDELYASMTDNRLKTLLAKNGISVPPKTGREELLSLALEHQV